MPIPNTAAAAFVAQADVDSIDFEIISAAANGFGVASGCACTPASSGSTLGVAVAAGVAWVANAPVTVAGGNVTPAAAHASLNRFDLVAVDSTGAKSVVAGTAAANPVFPAIPASSVVLCAVWIPATATSIVAGNIVDKRQMVVARPARIVTSVSANTTLTDAHDVLLVDDAAAARDITLPTAVGRQGRDFTVIKITMSVNYVRMLTTSSQTINEASSYVIQERWESVTFISDGANWVIL